MFRCYGLNGSGEFVFCKFLNLKYANDNGFVMNEKNTRRLDIELKNLVKSGASLPRLVQALASQGIVGDNADKIAKKYFLAGAPKKTSRRSETSGPSKKRLNQRSSLKNDLQLLLESGANKKELTDFAVRRGVQRQTAVKLVGQILGDDGSSTRIQIVQGGGVSPR